MIDWTRFGGIRGVENENGVPFEPVDVFQKRIDGFAEQIASMADRPVAIIGHGNVFKALAGFEMENCEVRLFRGDQSNLQLSFC